MASIRRKRTAGVDLREVYFRPQPSGKYLLGLSAGATHKNANALLTLVLVIFFVPTGQMRKSFSDIAAMPLARPLPSRGPSVSTYRE